MPGGGAKRYLISAVTFPPVASSILAIRPGHILAFMPCVGGAQLAIVSVKSAAMADVATSAAAKPVLIVFRNRMVSCSLLSRMAGRTDHCSLNSPFLWNRNPDSGLWTPRALVRFGNS